MLVTWRSGYTRIPLQTPRITRISCMEVGFTPLAMARTRSGSDGAGSKRMPALFTESYCTSVSDITKSVNSRTSNTGSSTTAVAVVAPRWPFPTAEEPGGHAAVRPCARSMCHGAACRSGAPCGTCIRSHCPPESTAVEHQDLQHRARGGPKPWPCGRLRPNFDVLGAVAFVFIRMAVRRSVAVHESCCSVQFQLPAFVHETRVRGQ